MQTSILIVGAGPAGLCSSISLSRLGIRSVLIERHPSTSIHPKATGVSTRTMELFRAWGLEPRIRELALDVDFVSSVRDNLAAPEAERRALGYPTRDEALSFSATAPAVLAQDVLEPILAEHARNYSTAELRFDTELCSFEQTGDGVSAVVVDRATGERTVIDARYMIAADGANSLVRRQLGIAMHGVERIGEYLSILFRADLDALLGHEPCGLYSLQGLGGPVPSVLVPTGGDGRWILAIPWRSDTQPVAALAHDDLVRFVRRAVGHDELDVAVQDHQLVGIGAQVAERFRVGNVFLVGDSAHRTAPTGGVGMNTAIQAAHNLAWKLAAVVRGFASPELLDSYDAERRPSGERNLLRSRGQLQGVSGVAADLGVVYASTAVVREAGIDPVDLVEPTLPSCVGARAPHVWLEASGRQLSMLDLFGDHFVLLAGARGDAWRFAALEVASDLGVPLHAVTIGQGPITDPSGQWLERYGIDPEGAVLVRPDGHIAWRASGATVDAGATLREVMGRVLSLSDEERLAPKAARTQSRRCA